MEVSGLVGVADEGVGAVGDEGGVAGGAHRGQVGDVVGAAPGAGSEVVDLESVAAAAELTARDRGAAPPARSWGTGRGKRFPIAIGVPWSSTSTGSMVALARSCSNTESAMGTPAISAGPDNGTSVCTTGRGASVGVSSFASGCSHKLHQRVGGAVFEAVPRLALGRLALLGELSGSWLRTWRPARRATGRAGAASLCRASTTSATTAPRTAPANPPSTVSPRCAPAERAPPAPRSVPAAPTPHRESSSASLVTALNCSGAQRPLVRGGCDLGQRLQRARGLELVADRPRRLTCGVDASDRPAPARRAPARPRAPWCATAAAHRTNASSRADATAPSASTAARRGDRRSRTCTDQTTRV